MRRIDHIVVHCSAGMGDAESIQRFHTAPKPEGNGWSDIGYHAVIERDGHVVNGRPLDRAGAHVKGFNQRSIGICLVGGRWDFDFTRQQLAALEDLVQRLVSRFPAAEVCGHRDFPGVAKACPRFDVGQWWRGRAADVGVVA